MEICWWLWKYLRFPLYQNLRQFSSFRGQSERLDPNPGSAWAVLCYFAFFFWEEAFSKHVRCSFARRPQWGCWAVEETGSRCSCFCCRKGTKSWGFLVFSCTFPSCRSWRSGMSYFEQWLICSAPSVPPSLPAATRAVPSELSPIFQAAPIDWAGQLFADYLPHSRCLRCSSWWGEAWNCIGEKVQVIAFEIFVFEDWTFVVLVGDNFMEAVHVELANKGKEIVVFEVLGENFCG